MKLPELRIGKLVAKVPIIQGGMAIRLSTARLAAAVANEGGIGLIAASGMPFDELRYEIKLARKLSPHGIIGINVMVAAREFKGIVTTAIEEGIDLVVAGAGFSRDMFAWGKASGTPIVPIVSSAKLAKISQSLGASAVVVEGAEAGGHLGTNRSSRLIVPEVRAAVDIPVIGAGGVLHGEDIAEMLRLGANGVQMGSRFAASVESNGSEELKKVYLRANKPEDFILIHSPVGLPGQAIRTPFSERILLGTAPKPETCDQCLKKCSHKYCIIRALTRAQQGDVETGLVFSGRRMMEIHDILPVKDIFANIKREMEAIPD
ncbi:MULTISPECIES: nitronate monooxygenase family protein [unclassified Megasphaera]|uniref:NAD(P)H-dependent flavin oxidoreductase n=2 Tax=Megasphaera TaxID=906 RepID=UPI0003570242|nr:MULTISPECIES: nitronate monooxygenase [unclassified Megasphaera]MCI1905080.1 nitronate monooxygenase [Enterococcaceae bacterium]EPP17889.1 oxidoreductase [Megasphaera sp. NM10]MBS7221651.1 nitronate monooxygenase [Megasphaera sp.]MCH3932551.1 nitronate monooxygenase [Megasphaera sp.]MCH4173396.1 nitronate monooxygenase [Megasphaera sp.]